MPSKKLETFSKHNPKLAPLVQRLEEHMRWLVGQRISEVIPRVAAAQLGISEADTLGLLTLFQNAGLVKPRYDLVCKPTSSVVGSFYSLDDVPDRVECQFCGKDHDADDLRVDLVFELSHERASNAAA